MTHLGEAARRLFACAKAAMHDAEHLARLGAACLNDDVALGRIRASLKKYADGADRAQTEAVAEVADYLEGNTVSLKKRAKQKAARERRARDEAEYMHSIREAAANWFALSDAEQAAAKRKIEDYRANHWPRRIARPEQPAANVVPLVRPAKAMTSTTLQPA